MPTYVSYICLFCHKPFDVVLKEHNRGGRKHCSKKCANSALKKNHLNNAKCSLCQKDFYISDSRKKASKSTFVFCSRNCKNKAQAIGTGFNSMLPPHYGSSNTGNPSTYRRIAFENHPAHCHDCKWNLYPEVLDVHHLDSDRTNNNPNNLMILCQTCHTVRHFLAKNGRYSGKPKTI